VVAVAVGIDHDLRRVAGPRHRLTGRGPILRLSSLVGEVPDDVWILHFDEHIQMLIVPGDLRGAVDGERGIRLTRSHVDERAGARGDLPDGLVALAVDGDALALAELHRLEHRDVRRPALSLLLLRWDAGLDLRDDGPVVAVVRAARDTEACVPFPDTDEEDRLRAAQVG